MLIETPLMSCKEGEMSYPYANCGKAAKESAFRTSGEGGDWKRGGSKYGKVSLSFQM